MWNWGNLGCFRKQSYSNGGFRETTTQKIRFSCKHLRFKLEQHVTYPWNHVDRHKSGVFGSNNASVHQPFFGAVQKQSAKRWTLLQQILHHSGCGLAQNIVPLNPLHHFHHFTLSRFDAGIFFLSTSSCHQAAVWRLHRYAGPLFPLIYKRLAFFPYAHVNFWHGNPDLGLGHLFNHQWMPIPSSWVQNKQSDWLHLDVILVVSPLSCSFTKRTCELLLNIINS